MINLEARERRTGYLLVLPALSLIAVVAIYPLVYAFWLSFQQKIIKLPWLYQGWVGLANYLELVTDARFHQALVHTLGFTMISVSLELVLGLLAALVIHRARVLTGPVRAAVLLPWAVPTSVAAVMWLFLVNPIYGLIPGFLRRLGLPENSLVLLAHPWTAWGVIIVTDVWKNTPFMTLMLLAGLEVIPADLYEAAAMDGATQWQAFWRLTLPLLKPAILVALIFRTAQAFMVFDHIYALTGGGPGTATESLAFLAYQAVLNDLRFGYGSALAVIIFLVSLLLALLYVRFLSAEAGRRKSDFLKRPEGLKMILSGLGTWCCLSCCPFSLFSTPCSRPSSPRPSFLNLIHLFGPGASPGKIIGPFSRTGVFRSISSTPSSSPAPLPSFVWWWAPWQPMA